MILNEYLQLMVQKEASDLYLTVGSVPCVKIHGRLLHLTNEKLPAHSVKELAYGILSPQQITEFEHQHEMNLALNDADKGRFRINVFQQRNEVAMVIRNIKTAIPTIASLGLPEVMSKLALEQRGLILIVGATSSGKSTSLAAMIDHRNAQTANHIITIEDPIEFLHKHKASIVNQREVGIDTLTYDEALKNALRQSPDVIMIGEIRSAQTMEYAIGFSETGHLCLSTLHANNADQALDRIMHFFPEMHRGQLLFDLSINLMAIISQRLVPSLDGKRVAAVEVLIATPLVRDLINRGEFSSLKEIMERSENEGMKTFDSALYDLYQARKISSAEALRYADSQNNLRLRMTLSKGVKNNASTLVLQTPKTPNDEKNVPPPGEVFTDRK